MIYDHGHKKLLAAIIHLLYPKTTQNKEQLYYRN